MGKYNKKIIFSFRPVTNAKKEKNNWKNVFFKKNRGFVGGRHPRFLKLVNMQK